MALYKYNGMFPEVEVRIAGESYGTVEKGGSIVIPDEVAANAGFSDDWSEVKPKSKSKESSKDKDSDKEPPKDDAPADIKSKDSE